MTELVFEKGQGSYIYTVDGSKYLDMTTGIGVTNTGHCHPKVVAAAQDQLGKLMHGQVNIGFHKPMMELCDKLATKVCQWELRNLTPPPPTPASLLPHALFSTLLFEPNELKYMLTGNAFQGIRYFLFLEFRIRSS